ncbi:MAG: PEBP family protein [Myxococcaceae bacterium]|jgi:hypothetical protein|nr:PEBP family protein [Myxococcaceae bacterium]MCA3016246.1 PEBP family protein [Myxococcaceae bacterium]
MRSLLLLVALGSACSPAVTTSGRFRADVWADNWFSLSLGETQVAEDSVPITTERSFNKESFGFDATYPLVLNWVLKDYKKNDTGLEYIGAVNQQMGDGGFIAQLTDTTTGKRVLVSNAAWRCLVIHRAPINVACEKSASPETDCQAEISPEPPGWKLPTFDVSAWPASVEYTEAQVSPRDGYTQVVWDASARLIWSKSLKQDNTLLCKVIVNDPG